MVQECSVLGFIDIGISYDNTCGATRPGDIITPIALELISLTVGGNPWSGAQSLLKLLTCWAFTINIDRLFPM